MPQSIVPYDKTLPYIEDRNPWEIPISYLKKKAANEYEQIPGRRPSKMLLVNKLRSEVDKWRNDGYPGATATSQELLAYWFEQSHPPVFGNEPFHFYFCQREAIETIIYLYEIRRFTDVVPLIDDYHEKYTANLFSGMVEFSEDLTGKRKVKRFFPELNQEGDRNCPRKTCCAMPSKWQPVRAKPLSWLLWWCGATLTAKGKKTGVMPTTFWWLRPMSLYMSAWQRISPMERFLKNFPLSLRHGKQIGSST